MIEVDGRWQLSIDRSVGFGPVDTTFVCLVGVVWLFLFLCCRLLSFFVVCFLFDQLVVFGSWMLVLCRFAHDNVIHILSPFLIGCLVGYMVDMSLSSRIFLRLHDRSIFVPSV